MKALPQYWMNWISFQDEENWTKLGGMWARQVVDNVWLVIQHFIESDLKEKRYDVWLSQILLPPTPFDLKITISSAIVDGLPELLNQWYGSKAPVTLRSRAKKEADNFIRYPLLLQARLYAIKKQKETKGRIEYSSTGEWGIHRERGTRTKSMTQSRLSSECWNVQMWGLSACMACEHLGKSECGGKQILKTGKNEHGIAIGKEGL